MFPKLFGVGLVMLFCASCGAERPSELRVLLDHDSFPGIAYANLQPVADEVTADVNRLIPGDPGQEGPIICYEANALADSHLAGEAPITLIGPKLVGERADPRAGTIRVLLRGVAAPADRWRLALQLSHELAHVKMNARYDNALIETLATAVSFQVLRDLGLYGYLLRTEGEAIQTLPEPIQYAYAFHNRNRVQKFWQAEVVRNWGRLDDRPSQTLGAMVLLDASRTRWSALLGISRMVIAQERQSSKPFQIARPDIDALLQRPLGLSALGYSAKAK